MNDTLLRAMMNALEITGWNLEGLHERYITGKLDRNAFGTDYR